MFHHIITTVLGISLTIAFADSTSFAAQKPVAPIKSKKATSIFKPGVPLKTVGGENIGSDAYATPHLADVDGDGHWDLIVGNFMNHTVPKTKEKKRSICGTVHWHRNLSTKGIPKFGKKQEFKTVSNKPVAAHNW